MYCYFLFTALKQTPLPLLKDWTLTRCSPTFRQTTMIAHPPFPHGTTGASPPQLRPGSPLSPSHQPRAPSLATHAANPMVSPTTQTLSWPIGMWLPRGKFKKSRRMTLTPPPRRTSMQTSCASRLCASPNLVAGLSLAVPGTNPALCPRPTPPSLCPALWSNPLPLKRPKSPSPHLQTPPPWRCLPLLSPASLSPSPVKSETPNPFTGQLLSHRTLITWDWRRQIQFTAEVLNQSPWPPSPPPSQWTRKRTSQWPPASLSARLRQPWARTRNRQDAPQGPKRISLPLSRPNWKTTRCWVPDLLPQRKTGECH